MASVVDGAAVSVSATPHGKWLTFLVSAPSSGLVNQTITCELRRRPTASLGRTDAWNVNSRKLNSKQRQLRWDSLASNVLFSRFKLCQHASASRRYRAAAGRTGGDDRPPPARVWVRFPVTLCIYIFKVD